MTDERGTLKASCQYNHLKGVLALDKQDTDSKRNHLYKCDDGKIFIGWRFHSEHPNQTHIKIMSIDKDSQKDGVIQPNAKIYCRKIDISANDFINSFKRVDMVVLEKTFQDNLKDNSQNSSDKNVIVLPNEFMFSYEE